MNETRTTTSIDSTAATATTPSNLTPAAPAKPTGAPGAATGFAPITQAEINAFADKLAKSGLELPLAERSLLNMIVAQARAITPTDVRVQQLQVGFDQALRSVIDAQARAWGAANQADGGWARIDPIWYKAGADEASGSIEISVPVGKVAEQVP
jgi:hypothetical protein